MNQPPLIPTPRNDYPDDFELFWNAYPKRPGNPKRAAFRCYQQRLKQGHRAAEMIAGAHKYAQYCKASGSEGTPYAMMARTFLGPDLHFLEDWEPPEERPAWATLPTDDEKLWDFAKEHGLPNPGMLNFRQYRRLLQDKINERLGEKHAASG